MWTSVYLACAELGKDFPRFQWSLNKVADQALYLRIELGQTSSWLGRFRPFN